jgi:hypothetical protein
MHYLSEQTYKYYPSGLFIDVLKMFEYVVGFIT